MKLSGKTTRTTATGFTLIELLVVLLILGLLAGLVGPRVLKYLGGAKSDTAQLQIEEFGAGLDLFHLEVGRYPTTEQGLDALVSEPTADEAAPAPAAQQPPAAQAEDVAVAAAATSSASSTARRQTPAPPRRSRAAILSSSPARAKKAPCRENSARVSSLGS